MLKSAVIFGSSGQDGYYLKQLLESNKISVTCISRTGLSDIKGDISDKKFVESILSNIVPTYIFNFAAISSVSELFFEENFSTISIGSLNVLEAAFRICPDARIFITGSGLQFNNLGNPIKETDDFCARDPYSLFRIQSIYAARYYRAKGLKVYVGYLFHHDSPRRGDFHLSMYIKRAIKKILSKEISTLELDDISVRKEWGYAPEIVKGIFALINQDVFFEATIGTGIAYSIEDWLKICFEKYGLDYSKYVINKGIESPFSILYSDITTITKIGWAHNCTINELSNIILND